MCSPLTIRGFSFGSNRAGDVKNLKSFTPFLRDVSQTLWELSVCSSQDTAAAAPSNATARWPWECRAVASFWQHDKSLNQRTGPTPPHTSKKKRKRNRAEGSKLGKKGMPSHRVPEVMVWKCTMSLSVFCYVPVRWREKTGKRGSWWNDYIVAERGRGPRVEQLAETIIV